MPPHRKSKLLATHPEQSAWEQAFSGSTMDWCIYEDEFYQFDSTATVGNWTVVADAGGAEAGTDAVNGVLSIATDGDDNDSTEVSSTYENWLFAADKPLFFLARVKCTEANTDDANLFVGLSDTVATDSMLDNGGGPMASYDGAGFFKVDGGTVWQFESSNAATQVTNSSLATFTTATWYWLAMEYWPNDDVTGHIIPWTKAGTGSWLRGTKQNITLSGLAEMHILLCAKAGGANAETLLVDYVGVAAKRT